MKAKALKNLRVGDVIKHVNGSYWILVRKAESDIWSGFSIISNEINTINVHHYPQNWTFIA